MAGFKLDFAKANDGNVADGTYEVVVNTCHEDANPNTGTEFIQLDMVIRNDIEQKYQNAHIFHRFWKSKEDGKYSMSFIFAAAKAFGLENGKEYETLEDFLSDFNFKPGRVRVKNESREYNGETYENLNVKQFSESKFADGINHEWKDGQGPDADPFAANGQTVDIDDKDLPF